MMRPTRESLRLLPVRLRQLYCRRLSLQCAVEEFESVDADPSVHFLSIDLVRVNAERARNDFTPEVASGEKRVVRDVGDNLDFSVRNCRRYWPRVDVGKRLVIFRADDDADRNLNFSQTGLRHARPEHRGNCECCPESCIAE